MNFSRRDALTTGIAAAGGLMGTVIAGCTSPGIGSGNTLPRTANDGSAFGAGALAAPDRSRAQAIPSEVTKQIEQIFQAQGTTQNGVFSIQVDRNDITDVTLHGIRVTPSFQINGGFYFQSIGSGLVMMNGDMCLKTSEMLPWIDRLIAGNLIFQAEHQHFYDFSPIVWFTHFRAAGNPLQIARALKAALDVTSAPFPQTLPTNPKTPLPAMQIGQIIGANPTIGSNGVVSLNVPRANPIVLGGIRINPYLNVMTPIAFQPIGGGMAAAVSDFGMLASEIQKVVAFLRARKWDSGCLYNQETDEIPQLYFDHMFKTGDPLELAREIRSALDLMDVVCSPPSAVKMQ
jgi:hypothetical protein